MITTIGPRTEDPSWRCDYFAAGILTRQSIRREPEGLMPQSAAEVETLECSTVLAASRESAARLSALRILVVDGNGDLAGGLSRFLHLCGHWVEYAQTGAAALRLAHAFQPEFVLIDVSLPDLCGYEVAALLPGVISLEPPLVASVSGYCGGDERTLSQAAVPDGDQRNPRRRQVGRRARR